MDYQKYLDLALGFVERNAMSVIVAFIILIIGFWISNKIVNVSKKVMKKRGVDETLRKFLSDLLGWFLKILVVKELESRTDTTPAL